MLVLVTLAKSAPPSLTAMTTSGPAALAARRVFTGTGFEPATVRIREADDMTLLGAGFALRLARNLAQELGGSLSVAADSLTLQLPTADDVVPEQVQCH
jgi:hypothetical protein